MTTPPKKTPPGSTSNSTRTERRLVASIRKAKTGADQPGDAEPAGEQASAGATASAPAVRAKPSGAGAAARTVARKRPASGADAGSSVEGYQIRRRVWPD
ncbi:hypothetical protein [Thiocapsa rosea]|uniref:Uncharacterized protein n=1 Tax=Thiocapsa rosea TaxID=69360 RepID=A0A495VDZ5_9GAMM|nr:hypothetical protein [Thiocapsa rosea]RKT47582.1 hypothetical protein BDD21_5178 [Thiocapsa rosea]